MLLPWKLQQIHLSKSSSMPSSEKPSKATFLDVQPLGSPLSVRIFVTPRSRPPGSFTGCCAGLLGRELSFPSTSSVQRAECRVQSLAHSRCSAPECLQNECVGFCCQLHPVSSPAGFSAHPVLAPARSAVSAPSALASHMQTVAGSGPAAASQLSRHRLASLVTEQKRRKRNTEFRPMILKAGVETGGQIT